MPFQYVGCDVSSEECSYNPLEYFIDVFQEESDGSADNYYCDRNNIATAYLRFHTRFRIAKRYGVDVTGFNLERIAQMQEYGKKDPQELRNFLNDIRQASYTIRNHVERNFGAKEQEFTTDEFAIADPIKTPESKTEKPSGKEKKTKTQPER